MYIYIYMWTSIHLSDIAGTQEHPAGRILMLHVCHLLLTSSLSKTNCLDVLLCNAAAVVIRRGHRGGCVDEAKQRTPP